MYVPESREHEILRLHQDTMVFFSNTRDARGWWLKLAPVTSYTPHGAALPRLCALTLLAPASTTEKVPRRVSMVQITIEVPEALAKQLSAVGNRLPEVLERGLIGPSSLLHETYRSVLEFLANNPLPEAILNFKLTPQTQERISDLLDENRTGQLTPAEAAELDEYAYINRLISMLKARALKDVRVAS